MKSVEREKDVKNRNKRMWKQEEIGFAICEFSYWLESIIKKSSFVNNMRLFIHSLVDEMLLKYVESL